MMKLTRRQAVHLGLAAAAAPLAGGLLGEALAATPEEAIAAFTGGKEIKPGKIKLTAPEIAENGNTVPVSVEVDSPMTRDEYVLAVFLVAPANPRPEVAVFKFTPMSGRARASTRIRLGKTQDVTAIAKMSDGSFYMDKKQVKVTIGGCGG